MSEYIQGQVIVLSDLITNPFSTPTPNAPVDDATDVVTVYKPDGTTTAPGPTHGTTGNYSAQITLDQAGFWEYVWKSTGAGAGAGRGRFYVQPVP